MAPFAVVAVLAVLTELPPEPVLDAGGASRSHACEGCAERGNESGPGALWEYVLFEAPITGSQIVVRESYTGYSENCGIGATACDTRTCRFEWHLEAYSTGDYGQEIIRVDEENADPYTIRSGSSPNSAVEFFSSSYSGVDCGFRADRSVELFFHEMSFPYSKDFVIGCQTCEG